MVSPLGRLGRRDVGERDRGPLGHRPAHPLRPGRPSARGVHRRGGEGVLAGAGARPQGGAAGGPLHPVRAGGGGRGAAQRRDGRASDPSPTPTRRASWWAPGSAGSAPSWRRRGWRRERGTGRVSPFFIPGVHRQPGRRASWRCAPAPRGPNYATVSACATSNHAHRRRIPHHPARRGAHDDRRRGRGGASTTSPSRATPRPARWPREYDSPETASRPFDA